MTTNEAGHGTPVQWHRLILEMDRFKVHTNRGLAFCWKLVHEERYGEAVQEFQGAVVRWNEDVMARRVSIEARKVFTIGSLDELPAIQRR
jgi:hypothetical protein